MEGLIHGGAYFLGLVQWGRIFEEGRLFSIVGLKGRSNEKKSLRLVNMVAEFIDLNEPWSCNYGRKNAKIDMHNFPVRGHSHFLNSCPGVSSKLLHLSKHIDRALGVMGRFYHFQPSCFPYIKLITLQSGRS